MRPDHERKGQSRADELGTIAQSLAETAKELDLALVLFAQINRDNLDAARARDEYRPTIGDLHGSSDVEKVSFALLGIHRRQWYVERGKLPPRPGTEHDLEVRVLKQQLGPASGTALLYFDGARAQVADRTAGAAP
jgi:replicative DNA helicase